MPPPSAPRYHTFMKALFLLIAAAHAQTITKSTLHMLKVSAGDIHCTFTNYQPAALTGLHMECVTSTGSLKQDDVISGAGKTGQLFVNRDTIKWTFQKQADGSLLYKITANDTPGIGTL